MKLKQWFRRYVDSIRNIFHVHNWYYLEYEEWVSIGKRETHICTKCGERRYFCDT